MQKSKGFVSAVMFVVTLAMVACASTRTQKSAGEQVDDSVTTARVKVGPDRRSGDQGAPDRRRSVQGHRSAERLCRQRGEQGARHGSCQEHQGCHSGSQQPHGQDRHRIAAKQVVDDGAITTKVKSALAGDPRTKAHQINIETQRRRGAALGLRRQLGSEVDGRGTGPCSRARQSVNNEIDVKK